MGIKLHGKHNKPSAAECTTMPVGFAEVAVALKSTMPTGASNDNHNFSSSSGMDLNVKSAFQSNTLDSWAIVPGDAEACEIARSR
jgi:hypothetical protein